VVFDVVELRSHIGGGNSEAVAEDRLEIGDLQAVVEPVANDAERRAALEGIESFLDEVSGRPPTNSDVIEIRWADAGLVEDVPDRAYGEARLILDTAETLFFDCRK
jgi:hypothetical protein